MRDETNIGDLESSAVPAKTDEEEDDDSEVAHTDAHEEVDIRAILQSHRANGSSNFATLRAPMHYDAHSPVLLELEARILTLRDSL